MAEAGLEFRWAVAIAAQGEDGGIHGAGVLITDTMVLSCAHVVAQALGDPAAADGDTCPTGAVKVLFVGLRHHGWGTARVSDDAHWVPIADDQSGDLALLTLDEPLHANGPGLVPLRRAGVRREPVWARGFPSLMDDGLWAEAQVLGITGPNDAWWQLRPVDLFGHGYSGAAVVDSANRVLGVVALQYDAPDADGAPPPVFMITIEAVADRFDAVAALVAGPPPIDPTIVDVHWVAPETITTTESSQWLQDAGPGAVLLVEGARPTLDLTVAMTVRKRTPEVERLRRSRSDPPPLGSVHLAIDTAMSSVDDVVARIRDQLAIHIVPGQVPDDQNRLRRSASHPSTLVLLDVDRAGAGLVGEVLAPLIGHAGELCLRILVGLSEPNTPTARSIGHLLDRRRAEIGRAVADLSPRVEEIRRVTHRERRFTDLVATAEHRRSARLGPAGATLSGSSEPEDVGGVQCAVRVVLETLPARTEEVSRHETRLDDLRDRRLLARRRRQERFGGGSDPVLDLLDDAATDAVSDTPCDLDGAEAAVQAYEDELYRRGDPR